mmetsp:Transcript_59851/g.118650  ORF Transcript_59851/g.118650 Transcript_59851/m.118650 type:complete len:685 (-) Transcript_59851:43-2097(-)
MALLWHRPRRQPPLALAVVASLGLQIANGQARWVFNTTAAAELQDAVLGPAARQGWLGGDHISSFELGGGRYIWAFGDSMSNLTIGDAEPEGDALSVCNFFPAKNCAMPTNVFATWTGPVPPGPIGPRDAPMQEEGPPKLLQFHFSFDQRSGQPTSTLWPPGWGGSGHTPKRPTCKGCSLWQAPTQLYRSREQCAATGSRGVEKDKGGCCSSLSGACPGFCCHKEFYFRSTTGIASLAGDRIFLLSQMGKESSVMPAHGETYSTYGITVNNAASAASPADWQYTTARMPDTHVWPWSNVNETTQFFNAVVRAREQQQPDLVYLLGSRGKARVLARANLTDLMAFHWGNLQFWAEGRVWQPYSASLMPELLPLWEFRPSEVTLHWDERLGGWLVPEVDRETKVVLFRVGETITGPYRTHLVGSVPPTSLMPKLSNWDTLAVKNHPELATKTCQWVLSMVFFWQSTDTPPPAPGLHRFPRFLCVSGQSASTTTITSLQQSTVTSTTVTDVPAAPPTDVPSTPVRPDHGVVGPPPNGVCTAEYLSAIQENMACSDMGDGCHTCRKRAEWIKRHNGRTLETAYGIVAADFPQGCGAIMQCKEQLSAQIAGLEKAWDERNRASMPVKRLTSATPMMPLQGLCGLLAALLLTAAVVRISNRRNRDHVGLLEATHDNDHALWSGAWPNSSR